MAMGSFEWMEVEALSGEIAALDARLAQARARHNHGLVKVLREEIASAQQRRAKYLANISTSLANSLDAVPAPPAKGAAADERPAARGREKIAEPEPEPEPVVVAVEDEPEAEAEVEPAVEEEAEEITAEAEEAPAAEDALEEAPIEATEAEVEIEVAAEAEAETEVEAAAEVAAEAEETPAVAEEAEEIATGALEEPAEPEPEPKAAAKRTATAPAADPIEGDNAVWNQLSVADIEKAKRQLDIRRSEMLARHAEELKSLEADQAQIDTLAQAIDAFVKKFNAPADDGSVVRLDEKRAS